MSGCFFFFNDTATTEIYTRSLHDALPIYKAGMKRGDIIIKYNDKKIEDMHVLPRLVAASPVESTVPVTVFRNGREVVLEVTIVKLKEGIATPQAIIEKTLGIMTKTLHPAIAEQFGIKDGGGVVVIRVNEEGPAARENIHKGDIILELNRKRITSVEEMASILKVVDKGDTVLLLIKRKTGYIYISTRVD